MTNPAPEYPVAEALLWIIRAEIARAGSAARLTAEISNYRDGIENPSRGAVVLHTLAKAVWGGDPEQEALDDVITLLLDDTADGVEYLDRLLAADRVAYRESFHTESWTVRTQRLAEAVLNNARTITKEGF